MTLFGYRLPFGWRPTQQAVQACFMDDKGELTHDGKVVLGRLARFCRADASSITVSPQSGTIDPIAMGVAEGRREVWLWLQRYLYLSEKQVAQAVQAGDAAAQDDVQF